LDQAQVSSRERPASGWGRAFEMYCVYFAKSLKNGKVYVGFTSKKPEVRVQEHNAGTNIWSRQNKPLKLIYYENYVCEEDARLRERFYKTGIGKKIKCAIIKSMDP
jgi:putative endonuclease